MGGRSVLVTVIGVPGFEGVVLEDDLIDFEDAVVAVEGGVLDVEDNAVDAGVDSCVVEDGNVDVGELGKATIQYFTIYEESKDRGHQRIKL